MKFLLSSLLLVSSAYATELKSLKVKKEICSILDKSYVYQVDLKPCLESGVFTITNSKSFEFDGKKHTVEMNVTINLFGSEYLSFLSRDVSINPFTLLDWQVEIIDYKLGTYHQIKMASIHDKNVIELNESEVNNLPKTVLAFKGDTEWELASDYSSEISYFAIVDKKLNTIGYIAYQWFESEDADIKGYTSQNFDLLGKKVGDEIYESFGFHE